MSIDSLVTSLGYYQGCFILTRMKSEADLRKKLKRVGPVSTRPRRHHKNSRQLLISGLCF